MEPFLKWAGGKRWLVERGDFPVPSKYHQYCEPFVGSGAVLFSLNPERAMISDVNQALIDTYKTLAASGCEVFDVLKDYDSRHCQDFYYSIRQSKPQDAILKAARFIYLNRTCWNGLYRVNKKGQFNVPIGTKEHVLLSTDDFSSISKFLKKCRIYNRDFEQVINATKAGDFLFADPPYTVKHNNNGFVKYNEFMFSWEDQVRLAQAVRKAADRGVYVVVTNAMHDSIKELYSGFTLRVLKRASVIAASSDRRGIYEEFLITNISDTQKGLHHDHEA